ncbi:acetyl-CoA carboxylase subunit A [Helicobacter cholecystus]|uniref:acetyl-CoA carboxylase subunit A n=1 Tax=Helicobacter cholecystus TaxID=45498 RepID=UPI0027382C6C|nr:acetyl-CoA carboxylase subunit A [Helicobacter cholecystus]
MFKRILIANRGEIAVRIIRACKDLGIESVAIYSQADHQSLHVKMADYAYKLSDDPIKGYLDIELILKIAKESASQAIHPGYGFLSENALFAKRVSESGLVWIGPSSEVIANMGDKNVARALMKENGIPIVEGTDPINCKNSQEILEIALKIGYPVILKASAGGGGKGIRVVEKEEDLLESFEACKREARVFFGNDDVFIEKYISSPRHIEFQILADHYGNVIHLGERDCSIQRRHQKLVEIAPSPSIDDGLRKRMGAVAIAAAKAANYTNAGTVEFLLDEFNQFYFMEMNTRIQVEHGITEEITGFDLVVRQIRIAGGEILEVNQNDVVFQGYAIEARINAENVYDHFAPNPGKITAYYPALGPFVRVDSCVYKDYEIPPFYDSMIAKLIVRATSYDLAVKKLSRALSEFTIKGVKTTIPFLQKICENGEFKKGFFDTSYISRNLSALIPKEQKDDREAVVIASALMALKKREE